MFLSQMACGALAVVAAAGCCLLEAQGSGPATDRTQAAYHEGEQLKIVFTPPQKQSHGFSLGAWDFGAKVENHGERPDEKRLNLYVIVPGAQNRNPQDPAFDHNLVLNALPKDENAADFDVFWAIALDPRLHADVRSERELLLLGQSQFSPSDLYELDDAPGAALLRSQVQIDSLAGLRRFRARKSAYPRLVIVSAGFAVRAQVEASHILPQ